MIDFNRLLNRLDFYIARSDLWQKGFVDLSHIVSPSSYAPIIEDFMVEAFIEGVAEIMPELRGELEYYAYETLDMKTAVIEYKGKKYDAKKRKQFIKYLQLIVSEVKESVHSKCTTKGNEQR